jgi:aspartate aminotransferase
LHMSELRLSQRVSRIGFSPNAAASQRAKRLKAGGADILDLTIGEPDFETPEHVKAAAVAAIAAGKTRYTPALGTRELREAAREKFLRENGIEFSVEQIAIASGAKQVIYNAFASTLDEGDEVIIPAPYYPSFPEIVRVNGGVPVIVPTRAERGFLLEAEALLGAVTARTRWLIVNSPSNPCGAVYGEAEWRTIAQFLHAHPQVLLLLDEVYEHILFIPPVRHFLAAAPELRERVLVVSGGYGAGPRTLVDAMGVIQSQSTSGSCSVSQAAAIAALRGEQGSVIERTATYRSRRDALLRELSGIVGVRPHAPDGGFFVFADCRPLLGKLRPDGRALARDLDIVEYFLEEAGVAVIAGSAYGTPGYVRLSIAADSAQVQAAGGRIARAVALLGGKAVENV